MGANWVTGVRTAGLSAVMAKLMANPASASLALIGCGVQAHSHMEAFAALFPLAEIRAFGRGQANVDKICTAARARGLAARACNSAREAVEGADLVVSSVTLSYDAKPFVDAGWLKPGAFAAITDLALPWLPESMGAFGSVIIDDLAQEAASPKKMVDAALVAGDLGSLVTGNAKACYDPAKPSAFVFRGLAIGDFAVAAMAFERAQAAGAGTAVAR
jgi:ornithine cyclodeaminase/alanine dehydrogenase